jgi:hypothetical protein
METLQSVWDQMKREARAQNRTPFQLSSLMAMSAVADLSRKARWLSASTRLAVGKTGSVVAGMLIDHYRTTLEQIREVGYARFAVRQFRPYLFAAVSQFSPNRRTLTERIVGRKQAL